MQGQVNIQSRDSIFLYQVMVSCQRSSLFLNRLKLYLDKQNGLQIPNIVSNLHETDKPHRVASKSFNTLCNQPIFTVFCVQTLYNLAHLLQRVNRSRVHCLQRYEFV